MTDAIAKKRWVSFYEIYGTADGDLARLGTGIYEDVFAREVGAPRIPQYECMRMFLYPWGSKVARRFFRRSASSTPTLHDAEVFGISRESSVHVGPDADYGGEQWFVTHWDRLESHATETSDPATKAAV